MAELSSKHNSSHLLDHPNILKDLPAAKHHLHNSAFNSICSVLTRIQSSWSSTFQELLSQWMHNAFQLCLPFLDQSSKDTQITIRNYLSYFQQMEEPLLRSLRNISQLYLQINYQNQQQKIQTPKPVHLQKKHKALSISLSKSRNKRFSVFDSAKSCKKVDPLILLDSFCKTSSTFVKTKSSFGSQENQKSPGFVQKIKIFETTGKNKENENEQKMPFQVNQKKLIEKIRKEVNEDELQKMRDQSKAMAGKLKQLESNLNQKMDKVLQHLNQKQTKQIIASVQQTEVSKRQDKSISSRKPLQKQALMKNGKPSFKLTANLIGSDEASLKSEVEIETISFSGAKSKADEELEIQVNAFHDYLDVGTKITLPITAKFCWIFKQQIITWCQTHQTSVPPLICKQQEPVQDVKLFIKESLEKMEKMVDMKCPEERKNKLVLYINACLKCLNEICFQGKPSFLRPALKDSILEFKQALQN